MVPVRGLPTPELTSPRTGLTSPRPELTNPRAGLVPFNGKLRRAV